MLGLLFLQSGEDALRSQRNDGDANADGIADGIRDGGPRGNDGRFA
jgi:hypothetical protein